MTDISRVYKPFKMKLVAIEGGGNKLKGFIRSKMAAVSMVKTHVTPER